MSNHANQPNHQNHWVLSAFHAEVHGVVWVPPVQRLLSLHPTTSAYISIGCRATILNAFALAAELGLEPRFTVSETAVLPLNDSAMFERSVGELNSHSRLEKPVSYH